MHIFSKTAKKNMNNRYTTRVKSSKPSVRSAACGRLIVLLLDHIIQYDYDLSTEQK